MGLPTIAPYPMPTRADVPAPRVSWRLDPARSALLVHDMQRYFLGPFQADLSPLPELVANIRRVRAAASALGMPIYYTAQPGGQSPEHRALVTDFWGPGVPDDPELLRIVPDLQPDDGDVVLTKWRYSAFQRTDLAQRLAEQDRDQLVVTGVYGHIGVMSTCVEAFMRDIRPFLVVDAIADFGPREHGMTVEWVAGRCGVPLTTEAALAQLDPDGFSVHALRRLVATLLHEQPSAVAVDEDLRDQGLDSVRLMSLVQSWQATGIKVSIADLTADPTIAGWRRLLLARRG